MTNTNWTEWIPSLIAALVIGAGAGACSSDRNDVSTGALAGAGGEAGAAASTEPQWNNGCDCGTAERPGAYCPDADSLCEVFAATCTPTSERVANRIEVGCGKRVVSFVNGTGPGWAHVLDLETGVLEGGVEYSDTRYGPCRGVNVYTFGEPGSVSRGTGLDCSDQRVCDRNAGGGWSDDCLERSSVSGAGGNSGSGGDSG